MLLLSRCVCLGFIDETHGDGKRSLAAAGDVDEVSEGSVCPAALGNERLLLTLNALAFHGSSALHQALMSSPQVRGRPPRHRRAHYAPTRRRRRRAHARGL